MAYSALRMLFRTIPGSSLAVEIAAFTDHSGQAPEIPHQTYT